MLPGRDLVQSKDNRDLGYGYKSTVIEPTSATWDLTPGQCQIVIFQWWLFGPRKEVIGSILPEPSRSCISC